MNRLTTNPFLALNDEKLMLEYVKGNNMAFEVLFNRHQKRVYTYLNLRLSDQHRINIDEIFQNIFLKMHKSRENYDSKFVFLKWLYTICRSELIDFFKYKKISFEQFDETFHSSVGEGIVELTELDLESISYLTAKEKNALELRYYSDNDFDEISTKLGTTPVNSRKIISRAIAKLRKKLVGVHNG